MGRTSPQTERLVAVIELLAARPQTGHSLADLARFLGVDKSTCLPMLQELVRAGWLVRQPRNKEYRLGPALYPIGVAATHSLDTAHIARSFLGELADSLQVAVQSVIPAADDLVCADVIYPRTGPRAAYGMRVGDRFRHCPPLGASFVAWATTSTALSDWLGDRAAVVNTIERYARLFEVVRKRGYVVEQDPPLTHSELAEVGTAAEIRRFQDVRLRTRSNLAESTLLGELVKGEEYAVFSINAPVFDSAGNAILAVCAVLDPPEKRNADQIEHIGQRVRDTANEITAAIHGSNVTGEA